MTTILPLTENIGLRSSIYLEERALFAARAVDDRKVFASRNARHFKTVKELQLTMFKP